MVYVKNSRLPIVIIAIILLGLGILIGISINKKKVYAPKEVISENENVGSEVVVIPTTVNVDESQKETLNIEDSSNQVKENNSGVNNKTETNTTTNTKTNELNSNFDQENIVDENSTSENRDEEYSNNDIAVINNLETTLAKVNESENSSSFADSAKGVFISIVDFLFYDGKIKGVTFSELTDAGKEKVLEIASKIDGAIENKIPGYKDSISSTASKALNKASELIKKGANNLNDFAKEKLGEENYQDIIDAKDELVYYTKNAINFIGDVGSNLFNSVKDKLSSWYDNFKNS